MQLVAITGHNDITKNAELMKIHFASARKGRDNDSVLAMHHNQREIMKISLEEALGPTRGKKAHQDARTPDARHGN